MAWQSLWRIVARHRELALGLTFVAVAGWELVEFLALEGRSSGGPLPFTLHSAQVVLGLGVAWAVIRAWHERGRHEEALARMVEKVVMAQEEERRRIAYDLHDAIAPLIVSAKQHLDVGRHLARPDPRRAEGELDRAAERLDRAISETRRVLQALRPSAVDSLGLREAMRRAVEDAARSEGWTAGFAESLGETRLPPAVETAAFRILQESLANASRHAGCTRVDVLVSRASGWLRLDVRDDGIGFGGERGEADGRGLGLAGMRERARLLGGTCSVESQPGAGTSIHVALPVATPDLPAGPALSRNGEAHRNAPGA